MDDDLKIGIEIPITDPIREQLALFELKFLELWSNWQSLKVLGVKLGGSFQNRGNGKVRGGGCGIERHRLKGLYLDYRFFHAEKEDTHFYKVMGLVGRFSNDEALRRFLKEQKQQWVQANCLQDWQGYSADELMRPFFNGEIFHSDRSLQEELNAIKESMNSELHHHILTFCIYNRMLAIRNLRVCLMPLLKGENYLEVPIRYAK